MTWFIMLLIEITIDCLHTRISVFRIFILLKCLFLWYKKIQFFFYLKKSTNN
ncbi:hypothetical protein BDC45DRAFT_504356 [Circinella umbellata]|nr:hypothetical protein BDC45DRAFT_504356 [Circinella umbellata]